jgi:hypothetical protein
MSADRELLRVSDAERQAAADRLRAAHAEGRLDLLEYDTRLARAYQAVTYRDLDQLFTDLPAHLAHSAVAPVAPRPIPATRVPLPARSDDVGLPTPLKVLWTIWACALLINLTVWTLVSLGNGEPDYFWPMWLLVPGVALFGATAITTAVRRSRR